MPFSPQEVRHFFHSHFTVRKYKEVAMPAEHLDVNLTTEQRAPTDATAQMYSFVRLIDPALRKEIATLSGNPHFATASEAFVICADVCRLQQILEAAGFEFAHIPHIAIHFGIGDAVMAAQNMLIAAEMLGYQGCWIGGVLTKIEDISERLQLPAGVFPFAGMTIGVPDEPAQFRPRLERTLVIHENFYQQLNSEKLQQSVVAMGPITARGDWAQTLARYFGKSGAMEEREVILREFLKKKLNF